MKTLSILIPGALLPFVIAAVWLGAGFFDIAAEPPSALETAVGHFALDRSVARRAPDSANPFEGSEDAIGDGLRHYREMCIVCHGAPGLESAEAGFAESLSPPAPHPWGAMTQNRSDGDLFWITKNGVRFSGMSAFGSTHSDEEIWKIVAFLRRLPRLTAPERSRLSESATEGHHHGGGHHPVGG